jgi:TPR repeat protein
LANALPLLQKAAAGGNTSAMNKLGDLSYDGKGVAQDYGKAREWYQKAADAGNTVAMTNLGWHCAG